MQVVENILRAFGNASGLDTNMENSVVYPVCCDGLDLQHVMEAFLCQVKQFPCTYLGLPLHFKKLRRVDIQPLINKVGAKLTTWKEKLLNKAERLRLINLVLTSAPNLIPHTFHITKMDS